MSDKEKDAGEPKDANQAEKESGKAAAKLSSEATAVPRPEGAPKQDDGAKQGDVSKPAETTKPAVNVAEQYPTAIRILQLARPGIQDAIGRLGMAQDTQGNSSGRTEYGTYKAMNDVLRATGLASEGWIALQTQKNSPLDHMNVDFVLINNKTGRLFFLDVTSTKENYQKINHPFVTMIESKPSLFDAKTADLDTSNPEANAFLDKTEKTLRSIIEGKPVGNEPVKPGFWFGLPGKSAPVSKEQFFPMPSGFQSKDPQEFEQETRKVIDYLSKEYKTAGARQRGEIADWMLSIEQGFNKYREIKWGTTERTNLVPNDVRNEFRADYRNGGRLGARGARTVGRFGAAAIVIPPILELISPTPSQAGQSPETW